MLKVAPVSVPQLGSCASSGRAWRLWAARHSQEQARPLAAQPLPRVLELAASKAANFTAFDHSGRAMALSAALAAQPILQRVLNALLLAPCAMAARCLACLLRWGTPPWRARWGAPGGPLSLLLAAPMPPEARVGADARASPAVFSLDGYAASAEARAWGWSWGRGWDRGCPHTRTPTTTHHHHHPYPHLHTPPRPDTASQSRPPLA